MIPITREASVPLRKVSPHVRVFRIDPHSDPRWHAFVTKHPNGSIYHHPAWIQSLEQEYGHEAAHLACETGTGELRAILPLLYTRGMPFRLGGPLAGSRISSLPRTPLAGPLWNDFEALAALLRHAVSLARQDPRLRLEIKTISPELDCLTDGLILSPWRKVYILGLPGDGGPFEARHIRRNVHKAAKLGVTVRLAECESDLRAWYQIYLDTMRRNFVPARPYRFFASLFRNLRPHGMIEIMLAELAQGRARIPIAGSIFLRFQQTVSYAFGAMDRQYSSLCANDAVQWQAIERACAGGFRHFDFGEVPDGHTELARFKKKWGAQPVQLFRYYAPALPKASPDSARRGAIPWLWRRLPLSATAWISDRAYSRL